jgi:two-component system, response regulator PdtaR
MTNKKPSILIVEDEGLIALHLQELLQKAGYDVPDTVPSGEDAIECMRASIPNLILMDISLDGKLDGIVTAREIRKRFDIPIMFLSAHSEEKRLARAEDLAPFGFIGRPFVISDLILNG